MPTNYKIIAEENIKKYGTDINRYGPVLLAKLYSDRTHFVYELLQNAEDAKATWVNFHLFKDRLEFRHNGRIFNSDDVRGICGLVESTKKEDLTQIGKFGIGFKSVYAYTNTPIIYSGEESFFIENYVLPCSTEESVKIKSNETLFIFPFNHGEVNAEESFNEISKRLRELGSRTLLFLNNIAKIQWEVECEISGTYKREVTNKEEHLKRICVLSEAKNQNQEYKEDWLIFERLIKKDNKTLKLEIAFKIDRNTKNSEKEAKELIVPVSDSCLAVFFPTEKETHLKFLIQGPYRTTPARDNIPKEVPWNKGLINETASLVADSLLKIKKLELLTTDFLEVLPVNKQDFPEDHMFRPLYEAVLDKVKSEEKLLPASDGSYISSKQAFLARGRDLIDLLGTEQLSLLFRKQNCQWLDSKITENSPLWNYFRDELKIEVIKPETIASKLDERFLRSQTDDWMIKFYTFLLEHSDLWNKPSSVLRGKKFIRLEDGTHVTPINENGDPNAYLPSDLPSNFKTIKQKIVNDENAKKFLRELGLTKPDELCDVLENIFPKYSESEISVSKEKNIQDIKKICKLLTDYRSKDPSDSIAKIKTLLRKIGLEDAFDRIGGNKEPEKLINPLIQIILERIPFLSSFNNITKELKYKKPTEIYLSKTYNDNNGSLESFFEGNPDIWFLDACYINVSEIKTIIQIFKISERPKIIKENFQISRRYTRGFSTDYKMEGLQYFLENNIRRTETSLYLWNLLIHAQKDSSYRIEWKGDLEYANDEKFMGKHVGKEPKVSTIYTLLTNNTWLPNKDGKFLKPSEIQLTDLPDDFDNKSDEARNLSKTLGFMEDFEQEYLSKLSEEARRKFELAKRIPLEKLEKMATEESEQKQFPEQPVPNEDHRKAKAHENYKNSPNKEYEKRNRSVRISQEQTDKRTFLREWYQDEEGKVICQICKAPSSFKNRQDKYYFEAVEIIVDEKEYDANALALCPLCAAKYQNGDRTKDEKIKESLRELYSKRKEVQKLAVEIELCGEKKQIQFVVKHLIDLLPIYEKSD